MDGTADAITLAPTHLGVQLAVYKNADGQEVQPFDDTYTDAFTFSDSSTTSSRR